VTDRAAWAPSFRISPDIGPARVWEVMEAKLTLALSCGACGYATVWPPQVVQRNLAKWKGVAFVRVAFKLRCGRCGSDRIRIGREAG
jgi:ribosomal protein S27AE